MEQYTDSQYDDDLTVGMDETEESFDTGFVDLFEHSGDDESPIARLKTIVLSIDWEINDEVLTQFNDELIDLKDIWGDDPIKMVYIQALEKISKYIYQQRSDAHPNAIKLLLTFYYDLEKIVTSEELSLEDKKEILREDVKKFEQLKLQIGSTESTETGKKKQESAFPSAAVELTEHGESHPTLFNLKACILGMDWEITERELTDLSSEVKRLEDEFAGSKPKMIFLQGIGALGGYIKLKKSNAHADAFKLLYSFYEGLEKIVGGELTLAEEKAILLPEVEKFEKFKQTIASTITPEVISDEEQREAEEFNGADESIAPAFADVPDEVHGFQADEEAATLGEKGPDDVDGRLDSFFSDGDGPAADTKPQSEVLPKDALEKIDSFFDNDVEAEQSLAVSPEDALKGVDVETEADDDSDEEALPTQGDGLLAPALAESDEEEEHGFNPDLDAIAETDNGEAEIEDRLGGFFDEDDEEKTDHVAALEGVNVETDADDDSDEAPLPVLDDEIAPALFGDEIEDELPLEGTAAEAGEQTEGFFGENEEAGLEQTADDIEGRLDSFFGEVADEKPEEALPVDGDADDVEGDVASFFDEPEEDKEPEQIGIEEGETDVEEGAASFFEDPEEALPEQVLSEDSEDTDTGIAEDVASFFDEPVEEETDDVVLFSEDEHVDEQTVAEEVFSEAAEEADDMFRPASEDDTVLAAVMDEPAGDAVVEEDRSEDGNLFSMPVEHEDEITFEAVDESELDSEENDLPVAILEDSDSMVDDDLSSFGSGSDEQNFFAEIDDRVDEPGEFQMEILDETDDFADSAAVSRFSEDNVAAISDSKPEDEQESVTAEVEETFTEEVEEEPFSFASRDDLTDLRAGIASLGVEINNSIIEGILAEINGLRHQMMTRPVEKTFLQLLSTIVQHIGQYQYEASAEAHGLMLSVFDKLELTQSIETDPEQAQEILLEETCKVLLWQQKMLDRQAVKKGDQLTFIDPLRSDSSSEEEKNEARYEAESADEIVLDPQEIAEAVEDQDFSAVFEPVEDDDAGIDTEEQQDFSAVFEPVDEDVQALASEEEEGPLLAEEDAEGRFELSESEDSETSEEFKLLTEDGDLSDDLFDETELDAFEISEDDTEGIDEKVEAVDEGEEDQAYSDADESKMLTGADSVEEESDDDITDFVRKEIDALRTSLQDEINLLKEQLKSKE